MSVIKYKTHKIIIFAICIIVPMIFMLELRMNTSETIMKNNTRRLQGGAGGPDLFIPPDQFGAPDLTGTDPIPEQPIEPSIQAEPQPLVQCAGVHALCVFASCSSDGSCRCKTYDSIYQIAAGAIKNATIRDATLSYCTYESPCAINEAPICQAIINDEYYVGDLLSQVTSAYSWNSFCERAWPTTVWSECTDGLWASCMMAPCTYDPLLPDFALCECDVNAGVNVAWIDNDPYQSCRYPGDIMKASVPVGFDFGFFMGTDYVFQACEYAIYQRNPYPSNNVNQYPPNNVNPTVTQYPNAIPPPYQGPYGPYGPQQWRGRYDGRNYRSGY
eukprot:913616_1